jgi:rod shape determining protein RodA
MATLRPTYAPIDYGRAGWRHFDTLLFAGVLSLVAIGVFMINSATLNSVDPDIIGAARRQAIYAMVGIIIMFLTASIDYRIWQNARKILYGLTLLFLIITLLAGDSAIGGVRRWIDLSAFPVQPSELAKILLILALAGFLAVRTESIRKFKPVLITLVCVGLPAIMIAAQPNLSTAVVYGVIWVVMIIAAGAQLKHLAALALSATFSLPLVWAVMAPYQRERILQFFDPNRNAGANYNLTQAQIATGSGGLLGQGYGVGSQSQLHFLKVRHTDFIFSVIGEELGFIGAVLVILLIALLLYRLFRIADRSRDQYGQLVVIGFATMIFFQSAINIAMNLNMGIVAGLPLPFVSYGGSSLLTMLIGIGVAHSVIMRHKKIEF